MTISIKATDSLDILVSVKDEDTGLDKDITTATTTGRFRKNDGTIVAATIAVTNATAGEFTASVATGLLSAGVWQFLAELQIAGKDQVVAEEDIIVSAGMT
jgi:hypothetical protein